MKNELPQNWVIDTQAEKDSPLMPKFMEWYGDNHTVTVVTYYRYIGFSGGMLTSWMTSSSQTIITLEQWNDFYFPEWEPKQGERVLVRGCKNKEWEERVFVVKNRDCYYCEGDIKPEVLHGWNYVKELPKESILQPLVEQLKAEVKKLGIEKVNITFE